MLAVGHVDLVGDWVDGHGQGFASYAHSLSCVGRSVDHSDLVAGVVDHVDFVAHRVHRHGLGEGDDGDGGRRVRRSVDHCDAVAGHRVDGHSVRSAPAPSADRAGRVGRPVNHRDVGADKVGHVDSVGYRVDGYAEGVAPDADGGGGVGCSVNHHYIVTAVGHVDFVGHGVDGHRIWFGPGADRGLALVRRPVNYGHVAAIEIGHVDSVG